MSYLINSMSTRHTNKTNKSEGNFTPDQKKVINDEVDNLLKTGKIREVKYPDWLAKVVVIQKKNRNGEFALISHNLIKHVLKTHFRYHILMLW